VPKRKKRYATGSLKATVVDIPTVGRVIEQIAEAIRRWVPEAKISGRWGWLDGGIELRVKWKAAQQKPPYSALALDLEMVERYVQRLEVYTKVSGTSEDWLPLPREGGG